MSHFLLGPRRKTVPSLKELASKSLCANRHLLGNVAGLPMDLILPVLTHFSPRELSRVEDATWELGGIEIIYDTWPLWQKHCKMKFGEPDMDEVEPLVSDGEEELPDNAGNYRAYYYKKEAALEERRRVTAQRARSIMEDKKQEKERKKIKVIDRLAPTKRKNSRIIPRSSHSGSKVGGNLLKNIGWVKKPQRFQPKPKLNPPPASVMNRPTKQSSPGDIPSIGLKPYQRIELARARAQTNPGGTAQRTAVKNTLTPRTAHSLVSKQQSGSTKSTGRVQTTSQAGGSKGGSRGGIVLKCGQGFSEITQTRERDLIPAHRQGQSISSQYKRAPKSNVSGQQASRKRAGEPLGQPVTKISRRPANRAL